MRVDEIQLTTKIKLQSTIIPNFNKTPIHTISAGNSVAVFKHTPHLVGIVQTF